MGEDRYVQGHTFERKKKQRSDLHAQEQSAPPQSEDSGSGHASGERVQEVVKKVKSPQATGHGIRLEEGTIDARSQRTNVGLGRTKSQVGRG